MTVPGEHIPVNASLNTRDQALAYVQGGLSVIPILPCAECENPDKGKEPALDAWSPYQQELPLANERDVWFEDGTRGIAIVCGQVSGGLVVLDFETAAAFELWRQRVEIEAPGLLQRLPVVRTPGKVEAGGRHVYARVAQPPGSPKLARTPAGKTLIEVKGQGGYVLAPGSPAHCHPSGRTYQHAAGPPLTAIPAITAEELKLLLDAARALDEYAQSGLPGGGGHADEQPPKGASEPSGSSKRLVRARKYLEKCDPCVEGEYGSGQAFKIGCKMKGFGLTMDEALQLILEVYNPICQPPWKKEEWEHHLESVYEKGSCPDMGPDKKTYNAPPPPETPGVSKEQPNQKASPSAEGTAKKA
jgi:putative DNA primase/helicase